MRITTQLIAFVIFAQSSLCLAITLDFNSPSPGTINDTNGLGTGFTTRLPGTGSALLANDANMNLLTSPGKLILTSTHADTNQFPGPTGNNLSIFEAPGVFVAGIGSSDVTVKATFENVHVPNGGDHLMVYAGVNENLLISAGIHELNVYMLTRNSGTGDVNNISAFNAFAPGDDIELALSLQAGLWSLSWTNLTTATSGSLPSVSFPAMAGQPSLYFGILASNAGTDQSFDAEIDNFSVTVTPEPGAIVSCVGILGSALVAMAVRRLRANGSRYVKRFP